MRGTFGRPTRLAAALALTALCALGAIALPAAAAPKTVSTGPWLTKVCKAYAQLQSAVDAAGNAGQLAYANANPPDGAALEPIFRTRFQAQDQAVSTALAAVKQAGTPSISKGKQLATSVVAALQQFHASLQSALQQVPGLATNPAGATQLYATAYPPDTPTIAGLVQTLMKQNKAFDNAVLGGRGAVYKASTTCQ